MRRRVVRRLAVIAAVLVAALLWFLRGDRTERADPTALPSGSATPVVGDRAAAPANTAPGHEVRLQADGNVLLDGEVIGLDGLRRSCGGSAAVTLRIESRASWGHTEWVLAALERAGVSQIRFNLPEGTATAVFRSAYWQRDVRHLPGGHWNGVIGVADDEIAEPGLAVRLAAERADLREKLGFEPVGMLYPNLQRTFDDVVPALLAFRDAGLELEFAFETGDVFYDWVPLPEVPEWSSTAFRTHRCGCTPYFSWVRLPIADMGEEDKNDDLDERVVLDLDRDGRLFYRGGELNLEELAAALRRRAEAYELKMRRKGESGYEPISEDERASRLYVLVRADAEAPFRQVAWILHVLAEERFYKVQFAVRRAPPEGAPGPCVGGLDCKLSVFLPTTHMPDLETPWTRWVAPLDVYVDPDGTSVETVHARDSADLDRLILARKKDLAAELDWDRKLIVYLHVAAGVTHQQVLTAVNASNRADMSRIDFAGTSPPDEATRLLKPLPR